MNKSTLPLIRMGAKPEGLKFKPSESARARFDKSISLAAKAAPVEGEIEILGEIGECFWTDNFTTAKMVKDKLKALNGDPVLITINSPGGDAFEGIAIYNSLREYSGKVTVNVIGMAASAASIIAMAGDTVKMGEAAFLMIHSAWGVVMGNESDMREMADFLDQIDQAVAGVYASRSGLPKAEVIDMMKKETWMTAAQAVDQGFADSTVKDKKASSHAVPLSAAVHPSLLAAPGNRQGPVVRLSASAPGASGNSPSKGSQVKTIAEQITDLEAKRAANTARMTAVMQIGLDAGRSTEPAEAEEFDTLQKQVGTIDGDIVRLKALEAVVLAGATPVTPRVVATPAAAADLRGGQPAFGTGIQVRSNLEKGIPFVRYTKALVLAKGIPAVAHMIANSNEQWKRESPEVAQVLMAAVAAGDTTTAGWASELVYNTNLASAFLEFLRPKTILGRIQGFTQVPFNVRWGSQTSGSTGYWVGQAKAIPISKLGTGSDTLGIAKAAGIVVLDKELMMSSSPSAEVLVRNDLAKAIQQFLDQQFIAPDYAAVANVSPASITNGVVPTAATGTTAATLRTDVQTLFANWDSNNLSSQGAVWVMAPATARAISLMLNALGQPVFPTMTPDGGTFMGYPVIVSLSSMQVGSPVAGEGNLIVLINAPEIAMADEGGVTIDASGEASIEMLDNPTNSGSATVTATSQVSMFQTDSVALRAIRFINWKKRRTFAVQYIKDAAYVT